ncbi:unnamed protein product [Amoebophrya sp. A120]|nr:unnamed protein product [Amoebophrya sp. A120]|eukprot:GSA120T00025818001.1
MARSKKAGSLVNKTNGKFQLQQQLQSDSQAIVSDMEKLASMTPVHLPEQFPGGSSSCTMMPEQRYLTRTEFLAQYPKQQLVDQMSDLKPVAIRRLARRGGINRLSRKVIPEIRDLFQLWLQDITKYMVAFAEHAGKSTISLKHVVHAIKRSDNKTMLGFRGRQK